MSHLGLFKNPYEFDMALTPATHYILHKGIKIDLEKRNEFRESHETELIDLYKDLNGVVGKPLKAKKAISDKRVKDWLYKEMKVKARTKTDHKTKEKKLTSDEDTLRAIMAEEVEKISELKTIESRNHHIRILLALKLILRIKEREKRLGTYINCTLDEDNRIRCAEVVGGTETGRLSHSGTPWDTGTNVATIPRVLREMFVADEGYELAEFDLNRGESWVYAYLSNDPELIRIHSSNGDFHSETASAICLAFGDTQYTVEEIHSKEKTDKFFYKLRYLGKRTNHASAYRMGPFKGAEVINSESDDTGITVVISQVKRAQRLWQQKYFGVPNWWWPGIEAQLRKDRTLITPYGRKRVFYDYFNDTLWKEATAWVPQSTSVDYLNLGMLRVFNDLVLGGFCELLHQQHDSILIQYRKENREEVMGEVRQRLTSKLVVNRQEISIPVEGMYGDNWLKMKGWHN